MVRLYHEAPLAATVMVSNQQMSGYYPIKTEAFDDRQVVAVGGFRSHLSHAVRSGRAYGGYGDRMMTSLLGICSDDANHPLHDYEDVKDYVSSMHV